MKLYVLIGGNEYDDEFVLGVFSTNELAEQAKKEDTHGYGYYDIQEFILDA